jgi:hypothetical protein
MDTPEDPEIHPVLSAVLFSVGLAIASEAACPTIQIASIIPLGPVVPISPTG